MILVPVALVSFLFLAMFGLIAMGRRMGAGRKVESLGAVEGAVFGLMGLLIAFTFASAAVRFETRRNLIVEEANDIGTAYLRVDLLPAEVQPALREAFRRYVDVRLEVYRKIPNLTAAQAELARMSELQREIWRESSTACRRSDTTAACLILLPALNDMFDITTTRTVAFQTHQPSVVFLMLALVMLACSLLAGYAMGTGEGRGSRLHAFCFAAVLALSFFVILDLEYPRIGLIRVDWMDRVLEDVRSGMK